ncbi:MAG: peptide ABC transporter substrate-binding protein [Selenomonadaceae bacterium]|nr:peptide ABC transporter substrate-binding protein [Selenomonadaceae bacterium]
MRKILMTVLLLVTMIFTGCGGSDSAGGNSKLSVMLGSNVVSLDSANATDIASFELIADCIDGLMQLDSDGKAIPALAESFDVSEDGKTYTFHLRDAKWTNGDPVTADDFVFAWRRHCQKAEEYSYVMGDTVACVKNADAVIKGADPKTLGVSAPDPKTFVVELDAPVPFFPSLMTFATFYPINEKFYNSIAEGSYGTSPETFLSNGAFALASYVPGAANIQLKKNDSYWNAANISVDGFQYQVVSSSDNALTSFKNGTLNVVSISGNQVEHVQQDAELSKNLQTFPSGILQYLSFNQDPKNHHAGALSNVNLRLAISNAIDRESLVNNYVVNGAKATYTAVPVNFAPNAKTGKFFAEDQKKFSNVVSFNVSKAQEFLAKAKAELGKDDFDLQLIYSNDGGTSTKIVQAIKSQVEENLPGVKINLQPMPKAEYLSNVTSDNYDLALVDWKPDYDDPMTFLTLWTTSGCDIAEHWSNAAYDKIIADCTTGDLADNYDARWNALYDAEKILLDNAVIAPLYTGSNAVLISPNVTGIEYHVAGVDRVFKNVKLK